MFDVDFANIFLFVIDQIKTNIDDTGCNSILNGSVILSHSVLTFLNNLLILVQCQCAKQKWADSLLTIPGTCFYIVNSPWEFEYSLY